MFFCSAAIAIASCTEPAANGVSVATDFYVAFPANTDRTTTPELSLLIAGLRGVSGTVEIPGLSLSSVFTTDASGFAGVSMTSAAMLTLLDSVENTGIVVHADDAVSLVAVSDLPGTMGTHAVPPASHLGMDYFLAAAGTTVNADGGMYMAIVATADGTTVSITPSAVSSGHAAGATYSIVLDRGQAYQLQADVLAGDIAGTRVTADKSVAPFGGHMCGFAPAATGFAGFLATPVPPIAGAGTEHVTVPLASRSGYWLRLLGLHDGTTIACSSSVGEAPTSIGSGQLVDYRCTVPLRIASTSPIIVMQMADCVRNQCSFRNPNV